MTAPALYRGARLDAAGLSTAKAEITMLQAQVDVVPVTTGFVLAAGDLAEAEGLRGYDAVHLASQAIVVATADSHLPAAAQHRQLDVSSPLEPRENR